MTAATHARERRSIDAALVGRLRPPARARLHDHLRACADCRAYHDLRFEAFRVLEGDAPRSAWELELVGQWLEQDAAPARATARWVALGALVAAAAAALVWVRPTAAPLDRAPTLTAQAPTADAPLPAPPASPPPVPPPAAEEIVFSQTFDERDSARWAAGKIVAGPPRAGSSRALAGERYFPGRTASLGVRIERSPALFVYDDRLEARFFYWLGETTARRAPRVEVSFRIAGQRFEFVHRLPHTEAGRWVEARVPLSLARPYRDRALAPTPGERVDLFKIKTNAGEEDVFFVDDIRILRR